MAPAVPVEKGGGRQPEDRQAGRPGLQQAAAVHPERPHHRKYPLSECPHHSTCCLQGLAIVSTRCLSALTIVPAVLKASPS